MDTLPTQTSGVGDSARRLGGTRRAAAILIGRNAAAAGPMYRGDSTRRGFAMLGSDDDGVLLGAFALERIGKDRRR